MKAYSRIILSFSNSISRVRLAIVAVMRAPTITSNGWCFLFMASLAGILVLNIYGRMIGINDNYG